MAAETIRDVVMRINLQQVDTKLKAPDLSAVNKEVEKNAKIVQDSDRKKVESSRKVTQEIDKTRMALEEESRQAEEAAIKIQDSQLKAGDAFKQAGEGAFTLARGIAFISTSSDENFQRMVQNIARIQGAFDVFKGGIETIRGVTEGMRALRAVTISATVAQTALNVAMGPVGILIGGLTVAVGLLAVAWDFFGDEAPEKLDKTARGLREVRREADDTVRKLIESFQDLDISRAKLFEERQEQILAGLPVEDRLAKRRETRRLGEIEQQEITRPIAETLPRGRARFALQQEEQTRSTLEARLRNEERIQRDLADLQRQSVQEELRIAELPGGPGGVEVAPLEQRRVDQLIESFREQRQSVEGLIDGLQQELFESKDQILKLERAQQFGG